jgi:4-hydroxybenzoate polyprenyltransferase
MQAQTLRALARLARLDRPTGTWLALLPAWWALALAGPCLCPRTWGVALLFAVGAVAVRGAGCAVNDVWDRHLDRQVARTAGRPVASGAVSVPAALAFAAALGAAGAAVLLQFNALTIAIGLAAVPLIALYPLAKRVTFWPQAVLALTFNLGALMGWAAMAGALPPAAWALYAGAAFWTLGYDTIYAYQDAADDARAGVKSSALALGPRWARPFVAGCYALAAACIALALWHIGGQPLWLIPVAVHMTWLLCRWHPGSAQSSGQAFESNRPLGLAILFWLICGQVFPVF